MNGRMEMKGVFCQRVTVISCSVEFDIFNGFKNMFKTAYVSSWLSHIQEFCLYLH